MHHHNVPLPEINFLKLVKKGMILIYFNSKIDNNLLVSPLYSKLGKKYSDLIRFSRHFLQEWHSFNIYGSSANVVHITEKMQCDHSFSANGFRWLKFTSALGLVKGDKKSGNDTTNWYCTSTTCTEDDNTNLLGKCKNSQKNGVRVFWFYLKQSEIPLKNRSYISAGFLWRWQSSIRSCHPIKIFMVVF